ncbi:MAG: hypothetical protein ACUZ77_00335 [Candidatus Brocadiales bacterium]
MFSRATIIKLVEALNFQTHAEVEKFSLQFGLEDVISGAYIEEKEVSLEKHLIMNPEAIGPSDSNLCVEIIEYLLAGYRGYDDAVEHFSILANSLDRDGYALHDNGIKRKLPSVLPILKQEDELCSLLDEFGFAIAKGHYEQAVAAHAKGEWAAANAQLRSFVEDFFNRVQEKVSPGEYSTSHARREALAKKGFFNSDLNEWSNRGNGFVQGFWKRLPPEGSHPGLSGKDDSTFRLHMVIVVVHYFITRLKAKLWE